jgi:hypothetical protein
MPTFNRLTRERDLKAIVNTGYRILAKDEKYSCGKSDIGINVVQEYRVEALNKITLKPETFCGK